MPRPQTLKPLFLATAAFLLAGLGQSALSGSLKMAGWILCGGAGALFLAAFRRIKIAQLALGQLEEVPQAATMPAPVNLRWVLLALAALTALGSLILFGKPATTPIAWSLHIASALLFIAAFVSIDKLKSLALPAPRQLGNRLLQALPIIAVLALAVFARLWQIDAFPFGTWYDEAVNGLAAGRILTDPLFRPLFVDTMPSHFIYLISLSFSLFGANTVALRLVTTAFGMIAVLFAYLLFRRWFGPGPAIVAAGVLAVMRYHLTFSRFGVNAIATPAFELGALYFLDRALAEKKAPDFAWLGLTLGFGLAFYVAFRLFPIVLALFLAGLLGAAIAKYGFQAAIGRYARGLVPHWLIAALGLLIAILPVAQFAWRNPEEFFARTATVSIFEQRDEQNLVRALGNNTLKHLEMFNVQGDRNGRHNLPGAPMLDPVMGALFILGAAHSIWRWRDPPNLLMLLIFTIMLLGGILSVDFEAPQSLRAIGVIPALVYFITLPVGLIMQTVIHAFQRENSLPAMQLPNTRFPLGVAICALGLILLLALITYLNFTMFFKTQKDDPAAWAAYSAAETVVASEMNRLAASHDIVLSARYENHPTVRFLAGDITDVQGWTTTDRLPLVHNDTGRGAVLLFDSTLLAAYDEAQRIYTGAQFVAHHSPAGGGPVAYEGILSADDLRAVSGINARYFRGDSAQGPPFKEEVLQQIAMDWTEIWPLSGPFVAELEGILHIIEYGSYSFRMHGAPDSLLWIDEYLVGDAPLMLARGNHQLRLQVRGSSNQIELWWEQPNAPQAQLVPAAHLFRSPVSNSGLLGAYYPSPDWSGDPAFMQIDPEIAFFFHIIPLPRPYSVEWTGKLFAPIEGNYRFGLDSIDGSQLVLDGRAVVDNPNGHTMVEGSTDLSRGWHDITIRFSDKTSHTQIYLYWKPPNAKGLELVPSQYLLPPMGQYPTVP